MKHLMKKLTLLTLILLLFSGLSLAKEELARLGDPVVAEDFILNVPCVEAPAPFRHGELDYLGDTAHVGFTAWDAQHNATVGRMIQYDPNYNNGEGIIYVAYADLPFGGGNAVRKIKFRKSFLMKTVCHTQALITAVIL